jgi:macrodomain Ter protein organizer (MatP/YcbG family)
MWKIYIIEFIVVLFVSIAWAYIIMKHDEGTKIDRGNSEHNREEDINDIT